MFVRRTAGTSTIKLELLWRDGGSVKKLYKEKVREELGENERR